jgi:hypothetical protein
MAKLAMAFLAGLCLTASTIIAPAADLDVGSRGVSHETSRPHHWAHHWRHRHYSQALVAGVRGASPLTVPFFAKGWLPGTIYYYGWQRRICCHGAQAVISAKD